MSLKTHAKTSSILLLLFIYFPPILLEFNDSPDVITKYWTWLSGVNLGILGLLFIAELFIIFWMEANHCGIIFAYSLFCLQSLLNTVLWVVKFKQMKDDEDEEDRIWYLVQSSRYTGAEKLWGALMAIL